MGQRLGAEAHLAPEALAVGVQTDRDAEILWHDALRGHGHGVTRMRRRRWTAGDWYAFVFGAGGLAALYFTAVHWFADWLSAEPGRWLAALALIIAWVCVWVVIGLVGSLLTALLAR